MRHSNISIFIPHYGCPCRCSFCNQNSITGEKLLPNEDEIDEAVNIAIKSNNYSKLSTQLAFFGGSFTAIDKKDMIRFLEIGQKHILNNNVCSIRISTRPDFINQEILDILKCYGVKSIELGAQSMCDDVLLANKRGHFTKDVYIAADLIKNNNFELGLQMMTGLYKSNDDKDTFTADEFIKIHPDTVRIYPTVVLKNTLLQKLYNNGEYQPQTIEQASELGGKLLLKFFKSNINVIRFGLHSIDQNSFVAGAFHPAISELAQSIIYRNLMLKGLTEKGFYTILVNSSELSKAIGQKKSNINELKKLGFFIEIKPDFNVKKYDVKILKG